jgi:transcriptional regulator with XRE-family HTH domain
MDLGISQPSMSRLENGHLAPDKLQPQLRQAMEEFFNRPVGELLERVRENMVL